MKRLSEVAAIILIVGSLLRPGTARALNGLSFVGVVRDGDPVYGLAGPLGVAVSPDGAHLYVTGRFEDAIAVFSRDPTTGTLTFVDAERQGVDGVQDMTGPVGIVVSPDGRHVYATAETDGSVVAFARDGTTGRLGFVASARDGVDGVTGLRGAVGVTVSPDGAHVYVAGRLAGSIAIFTREVATGRLTFVGAVQNGTGGVSGLTRPTAVAVSPDGSSLYASSQADSTVEGAVAVFARAPSTGALTFVELQQNGVGGVSGLNDVTSVVVSPDNANVYAAGTDLGTIVAFARNAGTGSLRFVSVLADGVAGVNGIGGVAALAIDSAGQTIYAASSSEAGAVTALARDVATGLLTVVQSRRNGADGVDGLQGTRALAVSPDGANVYVGGFTDNALATFRVVPVGGGCAVRPASGCRTTVSRRKASLVVRDKRADAKDLVFWKWSNGADTTRADFGDPTNATSYFLCVYSGTPSPGLVFRAEAPAGPGWKSTRGGALSYASKSGDPDGLRRIVLKPGSAGHAKIVVKGKGAALALPVLPLALPAKVQLVAANGQCWEADYSRPRVNAAARFAAKSD